VDWGDGTGTTTAEIPEPLYLAQVFGTHTYLAPNTYTLRITLTAACYYTNGNFSQTWVDTPRPGVGIAVVSPDVAISSIVISPPSVLRGASSTATITLALPAPVGGALVRLGSSDTTAATLPPGVLVKVGSMTAVFPISTLNFSGGARTVAITAVSGGVASSSNLRVR
jgi:hypothetical protein